MGGRAIEPSLSPGVVAVRLGRIRARGGHCTNCSRECVAENGPLFVRTKMSLLKHVYLPFNKVIFL